MAENSISNSYSKVKTEFLCDVCQVDGKLDNVSTVVTFCVDCMDCLCKDCMDKHSRNEALKTHKTLDKENFTSKLTPKILQELKTMTYCSVHEVQFDYICEDHGELICHVCTRKKHRSCTKISKIQLPPRSAGDEVKKTRNHLQKIRSRRRKHVEICNETERQRKLRKNILQQIQFYIEQIDKSDNMCTVAVAKETEYRETNVPYMAGEDDLNIHEESLSAVLELDDHEKTILVSKYVELSTADRKVFPEFDDMTGGNKLDLPEIYRNSERLQTLQDIVTEIVGTSLISFHTDGSTDDKENVVAADAQSVLYEMPSYVATRDDEADSEVASSSDADIELCDSSPSGPLPPNFKFLKVLAETMSISKWHREPLIGLEPNRMAGLPLIRRDLEFVGLYNCLCYLDINPECDITGVVVLKSHRVAITDAINRTIKVYDDSFKLQMASTLACRPLDLCVANQDSETVAISFGTKRLQIYSIQANEIVYVRGFDLDLYCRGICSVSEDIVALLVTDRKVIDRAGKIIPLNESDTVEIQQRHVSDGEIYMTISAFQEEVQNPFYIQVGDDKESVMIGEENQISTCDEDGVIAWYHGSGEHDLLNFIGGMAMDSDGNIYATDYESDNVHQVSSQDNRWSRVIIPDIQTPRSIAYDPHLERLIVGCSDSTCLSVYRFN